MSPWTPGNDRQTYAIIGAAMAVHAILGCGFLEGVYQAALAIELARRGISFTREAHLPISYKGVLLPLRYRVDFICWDAVLVEVKATHALCSVDEAQTLNYLKAAGRTRALLINFGSRKLEYRRLVWNHSPAVE